MQRRAVLLFALLCQVSAARAAVVLDLDVAELSRRAVRIVHGIVLSEKVEIDAEGRPVTENTIRILEALKGPAGRTLVVRQVGGEKDGRALFIEGAPYLKVGEEVVLFLEPQPSREGTFVPVGLSTAVWRVKASGARKEAFRDLRGLALASPSPRGLMLAPPRAEPAEELESFKTKVRAAVKGAR